MKVYLGQRNGVEVRGVAAAQVFRQGLKIFQLAEAATIAGMIQSPRVTRLTGIEAARSRRDRVIAAMSRDGSSIGNCSKRDSFATERRRFRKQC